MWGSGTSLIGNLQFPTKGALGCLGISLKARIHTRNQTRKYNDTRPHTKPHTRPHARPQTQPHKQLPTRPHTRPHTPPHTPPHTRPHTRPHPLLTGEVKILGVAVRGAHYNARRWASRLHKGELFFGVGTFRISPSSRLCRVQVDFQPCLGVGHSGSDCTPFWFPNHVPFFGILQKARSFQGKRPVRCNF